MENNRLNLGRSKLKEYQLKRLNSHDDSVSSHPSGPTYSSPSGPTHPSGSNHPTLSSPSSVSSHPTTLSSATPSTQSQIRQSDIQSLLNDRDKLVDTIEKLADSLQVLAGEKADCELEINRLTSSLNAQFQAQQSASNDTIRQLDETEARLAIANERAGKLQDLNGDLTMKNLTLQSRVNQLQSELSTFYDRTSVVEQVQKDSPQVADLTLQLTRMELELATRDSLIQTLSISQSNLEKQMTALTHSLSLKETNVSELTRSLAESRKALEDFSVSKRVQKEALDQMHELLKEREQEYWAETSRLQSELKTALFELSQPRQTPLVSQASQDTLMNSRLSVLLKENASLVHQLEELRERLVHLSNERASLLEQIHDTDKQTELKKLNARMAEMQTDRILEPISSTLIQASIVRHDLDDSQPKILELQNQVDFLMKDRESLSSQLANEQRLTVLLQAEVEALPGYIEVYHRERKLLLAQMKQAMDARSKYSPPSASTSLVEESPSPDGIPVILIDSCRFCHESPLVSI